MAPFGPFAAIIKVCPRDEITDPPGTNVFPIDRHGFAEGFVPLRTLRVWSVIGGGEICSKSSARVRSAFGAGKGRKTLCVSYLRRSERSAQVRQRNACTSYSQGCGEGVPMAPRPKNFAVR